MIEDMDDGESDPTPAWIEFEVQPFGVGARRGGADALLLIFGARIVQGRFPGGGATMERGSQRKFTEKSEGSEVPNRPQGSTGPPR